MSNLAGAWAGVAFLLLATAPTPAAEPVTPQVTVTSESTAYVTPDEVVITLGVEAENANLEAAVKEVEDHAETLIKTFRTLAIPETAVGTASLNISLNRVYDDVRKSSHLEYRVSRLYVVKLKEVGSFNKVVRESLANGANVIQGFEFRSAASAQQEEKVRQQALEAAKAKAEAMAKVLGAKVGKPLMISEDSNGWRGGGGANLFGGSNGGSQPEVNTLPTGQIAIRSSVTVSFLLE